MMQLVTYCTGCRHLRYTDDDLPVCTWVWRMLPWDDTGEPYMRCAQYERRESTGQDGEAERSTHTMSRTTRRRVETLWVAGGKRHIAKPKAGTLCGWFPSKQHLDRMPEFEMGEYIWEGGKPPDEAPEGYCKSCWQWLRYLWEGVSERVVAE